MIDGWQLSFVGHVVTRERIRILSMAVRRARWLSPLRHCHNGTAPTLALLRLKDEKTLHIVKITSYALERENVTQDCFIYWLANTDGLMVYGIGDMLRYNILAALYEDSDAR